MEDWKDIDGFPGYQVSKNGEVRSFVNNRHGISDKSHVLKPAFTRRGYSSVCLGRGNRRQVHRLVASAYIPNPEHLPLVRHMDDNPRNNRVENLAWGTQANNMQDCVKHGRLVGDTRAAIESRKRSVIATPKDGGNPYIFSSISEASRVLGVWPQHICKAARGEISQTGGYRFKYREGVSFDEWLGR